jgi:fibronectin-binding autotransporter adhesin
MKQKLSTLPAVLVLTVITVFGGWNCAQASTTEYAKFQSSFSWADSGGSSLWATSSGGTYNTAWTSGNDAVWETTAGTITIGSGGATVHNMAFNITGMTVQSNSTPSGNSLNLSGTSPTWTLNSGITAIVNPIITGTVGLTMNGTGGGGTLTLGGVNTYSGGTLISAGTVTMGSVATWSSGVTGSATGTGNVTVDTGGATISAGSGKTWYAPQLTLNGTLTLTSANRLVVGFNTLDLGGGNPRIINVNGKGGTVSTANGTSTITGNGEATGLSQWEFKTQSGTTSPNLLTIQNGTMDLEANGSSWTGGNGGTYGMIMFPNAFSGSTIGASFTGNGGLTVGSKVLLLVNNTFIPATAPTLTISSGGYVDALDADLTIYSLAGGGTYSLSLVTQNSSTTAITKTLTINGASGTTDFSGVLQNGPANGAELKVAKTGASTQKFSGANTYSGQTSVSAGTLQLGNATALGSGGSTALRNGSSTTSAGPGLTAVTAGAVDLNGQTVANEGFQLAGTGISSGGALVNSGSAASLTGGSVNAVTITAGGTWTSGTLSGPPSVTVNNTGTGGSGLAATAVVGLTGITTAGGSAYTTAPTVTISGGGGSGLAIVTALSSGVVTYTIVNPGSGYTSLPTLGLTGGSGGSGASISASSIGVVGLNVTSFGSGYNSAPAISIDNTSWTSGATATATIPSVAMTADASIGGSGDISISQPITGAFSLTKVGNNTLSLSGNNTYSVNTVINAGTLKLTGGSLGNTAISFTGTGTFAVQPGSSTTVNAGSTGSGSAGATLNLGGNTFDMTDGTNSTFNLQQQNSVATGLTLANGATLKFDLTGTGADLLAVTRSAAVTGTINVTVITNGTLAQSTYNLITAASGLTSSSPTWSLTGGSPQIITNAGQRYKLKLNSSDTAISITTTNAYTVTYDASGGINPPTDSTYYDSNAVVTVAGQGSMSNGTQVFGGWYYDVATTLAVGGSTFNISSNTTLYAKWAASAPVINTNGTLAAANTTYGSPSASPASFHVSGSNITGGGILVSAPSGFEVSKDGTTYATSVTVADSGGTVSDTVIYVRLAATTTYGTYSGNVVCSSGTTTVNVPTTSSTVAQLGLTVSGAAALSKMFDGTTNAVITGTLSPGAVNGDSIGLVGTGGFTSGGSPVSAVGGPYTVVANCTLSGARATNYSLTQPTGLTASILGTGIWTNTASGNWGAAGNWTNNIIATNVNNTADFSQVSLSSDLTVSLETPKTIGNVIFGNAAGSPNNNVTLNNNGTLANVLTLQTSSGTPSVTVNNLGSGKSATISAVVAGTQGLTKAGASTLTLANTNTYAGGTTVSAGILQLGDNSAKNGVVGGVITNNNAAVVLAEPNAQTLTNFITGSGSVTNLGVGNVTLNPSQIFASTATAGSSVLTLGSTAGLALGQGVTGTGITTGAIITNMDATTITIVGQSTNANPTITVSGSTYAGGTVVGANSTVTINNNVAGTNNVVTAGPFGTGPVTFADGSTISNGVTASGIDLMATPGVGKFVLQGLVNLANANSSYIKWNGPFDCNGGTAILRAGRTITYNWAYPGSQHIVMFGQTPTGPTALSAMVVSNGILAFQSPPAAWGSASTFSDFYFQGNANCYFSNNASLLVGSNVYVACANGPFPSSTAAVPNLTLQTNSVWDLAAGGSGAHTIYLASLAGGGSFTNSGTSAGGGTVQVIGGAGAPNSAMFNGAILNGPTANNVIGFTMNSAGSTETLSGTGSTYIGNTTVSAGTLAGIGAHAFGSTAGISIAAAGTLSLLGDSSTIFTLASDGVTKYAVSTTAAGATINADEATGAGSGAKTMTIGTLGSSSTSASYTLNFSGADNTSLSVGAITGNPSTSGTAAPIYYNNIASPGMLTIASYTSGNNNAETVAFSGNGNTEITGAIAPGSSALTLKKSGNGTLTLDSASTFANGTTISSGSVIVKDSGALGSGANSVVLVGNGASVAGDVPALLIGAASVNLPNIINLGGGIGNASSPLYTIGGNVDANATFSGVIAVSKSGYVTNVPTTGNNALSLTGGITNASSSARSLTFTGPGAVTVGIVGMSDGTGSGALSAIIAGGTVTLSAANTHSGGTLVNAGTLNLSGSVASGVTVASGAIFNETVNGVIVGTATLANSGLTTLNGTNTYSGATIISAGELIGVTGGSCSNSPITAVSGATNGVRVAAANGAWYAKALTNQSGSYIDLNLNGQALSTTVAPLQVLNSLAVTNPVILLRGVSPTAIAVGQYPLIKYGTLVNGGLPTVSLSGLTLAGGAGYYVATNAGRNTIDLVVTNSSGFSWAVGSGSWDINTSTNWANGGISGFTYPDAVPATLDDTASGASPILITNTMTVSPASVTNNATKNYTIYGGGIIGSGALTKLGSGTLTLANNNTYSGGTLISAGTLQLGDGSAQAGQIGGVITNNASLAFAEPTAQTITNFIVGMGAVTDIGAGAVTLNPSQNFIMSTNTVSNYQLVVSSGIGLLSVGQSVSMTSASGVGIASGAYITNITGNVIGITGLATNLNNSTVAVAGNNYAGGTTLGAGGTLTIGSAAVSSSGIIKSGPLGAGNLTVSGAASISNASSGNNLMVYAMLLNGDLSIIGGGRLHVNTTNIDLGGGSPRKLFVNSKSVAITNLPNGTSWTWNNSSGSNQGKESTGLNSWEIESSLGGLTIGHGTLDLETTTYLGGNGGNYGSFYFTAGAGFVSFTNNEIVWVGTNVVLGINGTFNGQYDPSWSSPMVALSLVRQRPTTSTRSPVAVFTSPAWALTLKPLAL